MLTFTVSTFMYHLHLIDILISYFSLELFSLWVLILQNLLN